ncbi:divalent-cation tolerance protein CutA [Methanocella sp. CWC-04]|uniref:Divalent-cation tolerance protein CutA n=1 Tax=Methanooceanicella nereidis TaxID=2052831 RepID=A0AAP2RDB6_9EURY|nr:divalent-cation tolerance protein CutA [Methanocella sp. CWC-04]MCD1294575.1 divalent-cation tolerance protein CutA [Methanocella sp. CWC-04]
MFSVVYISSRDMNEAKMIAKTLVEERLIACANYYPISSTFRWEGDIEEDNEVAIICKTTTEKVHDIIDRVKQLHSYEVPCITSWKIDEGYPGYLEWVKKET